MTEAAMEIGKGTPEKLDSPVDAGENYIYELEQKIDLAKIHVIGNMVMLAVVESGAVYATLTNELTSGNVATGMGLAVLAGVLFGASTMQRMYQIGENKGKLAEFKKHEGDAVEEVVSDDVE